MSTGIAPIETTYLNGSSAEPLLTGGGPAATDGLSPWLCQSRAEGWEVFQTLPWPARTDESWRFATLKAIDLAGFTKPRPAAEGAQAAFVDRSTGLARSAGRMVFANDELVSREVISEALAAQGVIWMPLEQAAVEHPELFQKHFMAHGAPLGSKKFAALHRANVKTGTFLYVPRGVEIDLPRAK